MKRIQNRGRTDLRKGFFRVPAESGYIKVENHPARDLMVTPVITATTETTMCPNLADLLGRHHVKRIPIVHDGKLVGIVSRADVVRAIARTPDAVAGSI